MPLRLRLLVFGYPALEIATLWWLSTIIGWLDVLGILIIGAIVGALMIRAAGRAAFATMRQAGIDGRMPAGDPGRHAVLFSAGLLVALPGVWTDLAGLLLLLPPVQVLVLPRLARRLGVRATGFATGTTIQGTTIQGTVIRHEADAADATPTDEDSGDDDGPGIAGAIER